MVSVNLVLRNNLIAKAKLAKNEYESVAANEAASLDALENALLGINNGGNNNTGGDDNTTGGDDDQGGDTVQTGWVLGEDGVTITNGTTGETKTIGDTLINDEVLTALGATGGTYTGTWTVIGAKDGKLKLVTTTNAVDSVKIGYEDPGAIAAIEVADESSLTTAEKLERSAWSYAHAIETLNTAVQTATGITNAESITVEDIYEIIGKESNSTSTVCNYYFNTSTSTVYLKYTELGSETIVDTTYTTQTFLDDNGEIIVVDSEGDKATTTITSGGLINLTEEQKAQMGSLATGNYWLASPYACKTYVKGRYYV